MRIARAGWESGSFLMYAFALGRTFSLGSDYEPPSTWAGPVGFLCLGLFLTALGMGIFRGRDAADGL